MADSVIGANDDRVRRYSLATPTHQVVGAIISDHVLDIQGDTAILGDHDDDGEYWVERVPWRTLVE